MTYAYVKCLRTLSDDAGHLCVEDDFYKILKYSEEKNYMKIRCKYGVEMELKADDKDFQKLKLK